MALRANKLEAASARSTLLPFAFCLLPFVALSATAEAQVTSQDRGRTGEARWAVAASGGMLSPRVPNRGSSALPAAGKALVTSSPVFPGRHAPSWFFGDGASQVNDVNGELGVPDR